MAITPYPYHVPPAGIQFNEDLGLSAEQATELLEALWGVLAYHGSNWALDDISEYFLSDLSWDIDELTLSRAWEELLVARRAQQESWPEEVRVTALTRAFTELADLGVIARQNFSCCGTCASGEIWDERDDSRTWRGYISFDQQDAESIPETRQTYVNYGVFLDAYYSEETWNTVAENTREATYLQHVTDLMQTEVFPVLVRHGIEPTWNGKLETRILLNNVDWYPAV